MKLFIMKLFAPIKKNNAEYLDTEKVDGSFHIYDLGHPVVELKLLMWLYGLVVLNKTAIPFSKSSNIKFPIALDPKK